MIVMGADRVSSAERSLSGTLGSIGLAALTPSPPLFA